MAFLPPPILYLIWERTETDQLFLTFALLNRSIASYFQNMTAIKIRKCAHAIQTGINTRPSFLNPQRDDTEALEYYTNNFSFPTWMLQPMNLSLHGQYSYLVDAVVKKVKQSMWNSLWDLMPDERSYFVTGGAIAQIALGLQWDSDVDVFVSAKKGEKNGRRKIGLFDFVTREIDEPQNVMRRFDITICQIGALVSPGGNITVFATPLFLCSLQHRLLVVQVSDLSMDYNGIFGHQKVLEDRFRKHMVARHVEPDFVSCPSCNWVNNQMPENSRIVRWKQRVEKYKERLPSWRLSYHFAPKNPDIYTTKRPRLENEK